MNLIGLNDEINVEGNKMVDQNITNLEKIFIINSSQIAYAKTKET